MKIKLNENSRIISPWNSHMYQRLHDEGRFEEAFRLSHDVSGLVLKIKSVVRQDYEKGSQLIGYKVDIQGSEFLVKSEDCQIVEESKPKERDIDGWLVTN